MFTYYRKEEHDEHCLYASEVAKLIFDGIYTEKTYNHATRFVLAFLNNQIKQRNAEPLYYLTKRGLYQVFEERDIIKLILAIHACDTVEESLSDAIVKHHCEVMVGTKWYKFFYYTVSLPFGLHTDFWIAD